MHAIAILELVNGQVYQKWNYIWSAKVIKLAAINIQSCRIKHRMSLGRCLSSLYSIIAWNNLTSWIFDGRSSKSSSLISINCKAIYCKKISILMKINIRINSNGTNIRFNIKIRALSGLILWKLVSIQQFLKILY